MRNTRRDFDRACATLGVPSDASLKDVTRAYKRLVKIWHPDQYSADPQGQAEAALRLREINRAFALVRQLRARNPLPTVVTDRGARDVRDPDSAALPRAGVQLSPSDIGDIAKAVGVESDFAVLSRIAYWGVVLGLSFLLIAQPGRNRRSYTNEWNTIAGMVLLCAAVGRSVITRLRARRADRAAETSSPFAS